MVVLGVVADIATVVKGHFEKYDPKKYSIRRITSELAMTVRTERVCRSVLDAPDASRSLRM